jgi:hypothetical protein
VQVEQEPIGTWIRNVLIRSSFFRIHQVLAILKVFGPVFALPFSGKNNCKKANFEAEIAEPIR